MKEFIKTWGALMVVALIQALLLVLFVMSEAKNDSAFLRILTGIGTLLPVGALIPFVINEAIKNTKK